MYQTLAWRAGLAFCFFILPCVYSAAQTPEPDAPVPNAAVQPSRTNTLQVRKPVIINGRPYVPPTAKQQFIGYLKDSYGLPAFAGASVRSLYGQGVGKPEGWGQDWPGYGQRFGSSLAVSAIN